MCMSQLTRCHFFLFSAVCCCFVLSILFVGCPPHICLWGMSDSDDSYDFMMILRTPREASTVRARERWSLGRLIHHVGQNGYLSGMLISQVQYRVDDHPNEGTSDGPTAFSAGGVLDTESLFKEVALLYDVPGRSVANVAMHTGALHRDRSRDEFNTLMRVVFNVEVDQSAVGLRDWMHSIIIDMVELVKGEAAFDDEFSGGRVGLMLVNFDLLTLGWGVVDGFRKDVWDNNVDLLRAFGGDIRAVLQLVVMMGVVFRNLLRIYYMMGAFEFVLPYIPGGWGEVVRDVLQSGFEQQFMFAHGWSFDRCTDDEMYAMFNRLVDGGFGGGTPRRGAMLFSSFGRIREWYETFNAVGGESDVGLHNALERTGIARMHGFSIRATPNGGAEYVAQCNCYGLQEEGDVGMVTVGVRQGDNLSPVNVRGSYTRGVPGLRYEFDFASSGLSWGVITDDPAVLYAGDDFWTLATRRGQVERAIAMMIAEYNREFAPIVFDRDDYHPMFDGDDSDDGSCYDGGGGGCDCDDDDLVDDESLWSLF